MVAEGLAACGRGCAGLCSVVWLEEGGTRGGGRATGEMVLVLVGLEEVAEGRGDILRAGMPGRGESAGEAAGRAGRGVAKVRAAVLVGGGLVGVWGRGKGGADGAGECTGALGWLYSVARMEVVVVGNMVVEKALQVVQRPYRRLLARRLCGHRGGLCARVGRRRRRRAGKGRAEQVERGAAL